MLYDKLLCTDGDALGAQPVTYYFCSYDFGVDEHAIAVEYNVFDQGESAF